MTLAERLRQLLAPQYVVSSGAGTIVTANPGCMMQLQRGVRDAGLATDVKHIVELVDEAYRAG